MILSFWEGGINKYAGDLQKSITFKLIQRGREVINLNQYGLAV